MFPLKSGHLPQTNVENIIFITRPEISCMDMIADNVKGLERRKIHCKNASSFKFCFL